MHRRQFLSLALLSSLLAGCVQRVELDRAAAAGVRRVAVVSPAVPSRPTTPMLNAPGMWFGLVGGLVEAAVQETRDQRLRAALEGQGYRVRERLPEHLAQALEAAGFQARILVTERSGTEFLQSYPGEPVDAFLDLAVWAYGYGSHGPSSPYRPFATVALRLAGADGRPIVQDSFSVNWPALGWTATSTARGDALPASRPFEGDPARIVAGVDGLLRHIAEEAVRRLR
jgi:hypothetical protein